MLSRSNSAWTADDEDGDNELAEHLDYDANDDEDEFGLPSIANSRRSARRAGGPSLEILDKERRTIPGGGFLDTDPGPGRARANSSDIAEERGTPSYPVPRKSEGKILRPQYKEILRGWWIHSSIIVHRSNRFLNHQTLQIPYTSSATLRSPTTQQQKKSKPIPPAYPASTSSNVSSKQAPSRSPTFATQPGPASRKKSAASPGKSSSATSPQAPNAESQPSNENAKNISTASGKLSKRAAQDSFHPSTAK